VMTATESSGISQPPWPGLEAAAGVEGAGSGGLCPRCDAEGWYAIAFSAELAAGQVVTRRLAGRELVVFRTRSGRVAAAEAHCPHRGAHLGHGGTVTGECLRCPFHGLKFDVTGSCVSAPSGPPPARARLAMLPLRETSGFVLAHHDPTGAAPSWEVRPGPHPAGDTDAGIPAPAWHRSWRFRGCLQDVTENAFDTTHFTELHRFAGWRVEEQPVADGSRLRMRSSVRYSVPMPGGMAPVEMADVALTAATYGMGVGVLEADINIWKHQRHAQRPALTTADTAAARYRAWTRQFYTYAKGSEEQG
jgi:phenylpropionate dioxygenase-like ring-hydroxylating dioxygenase large terminal subunit